MHIAGLASNRGRNLINIHERAPGGAELAVVVSDSPDAPILEKARDRGIDATAVVPEDGESRGAYEERINEVLADYDHDLVCLDGFMRILSDTFIDAQPTTLNIHPSLLPSFPGDDGWGDALDAGVDVTGCTVHVITDATDEDGTIIESEIDAGPIVTQEPVAVYGGDDEESLKERILYSAEFRAYPRAVKWFAEDAVTVDYDAGVVHTPTSEGDGTPPRYLASADRVDTLRYGENPHQDAAAYADYTCGAPSVLNATQHNEGAKGLSYNNYNDADAALHLVCEFTDPAAAVIKHTNPAGAAVGDTLVDAYEDALATDAKSAFGGIVALNRTCDESTATAITDSFKEVVVAPDYSEDALDVLTAEDDLRVLSVGDLHRGTEQWTEKKLVGGRLRQERDDQAITAEDLEVVTDRAPTADERETMVFAWQVIKHVKSNAIVFADGTETVGVGAGQVSRVDAVDIAAMKAEADAEGKSAEGAVMASDAFLPFPDALEVAAEAGIDTVVQPGGSVNDDTVIEAADELGMAMAFTGSRCFRHD